MQSLLTSLCFPKLLLLLAGLGGSSMVLADPVERPGKPTRHTFAEPHLGTFVRLIFYSADARARATAKKKADQCFRRVKTLDAIFSDYRDDSELTRLCQKPIKVPHKVSEELFEVITFAQEASAQSGGAFDITLGRDTKRWRDRRDGKTAAVHSGQQTQVSYRSLVLNPKKRTVFFQQPLQLDLGGIAKGYIADQLLAHLKASGIKQTAVIIGGEIALGDAPPEKKGWRIGLSDPEQNIIGSLVLSNTALSTSGDSYQFFEKEDGERRAHLIDPTSRQGKSNRLNVTTIAPTGMRADAWATAFRIMPTGNAFTLAERVEGIEALFIPLEGKRKATGGFPALEKSK